MLHLRGSFTRFLFVLSLSLFIAACGSAEEAAEGDIAPEEGSVAESLAVSEATATNTPEPTPTPEPSPTPEPTPETELPTEIIEPSSPIAPSTAAEEPVDVSPDILSQAIPGSEEPLAAAIADLANQTGLPPEQISLVSMEAVDWSDASLGCPQEGYMYAQVITPGFRIILEADGQQYEYHTDRDDTVVLCQQDQ